MSTLSLVLLSGTPEVGSLKSPSGSRGPQRYVIEGLSEKSSMVTEPWERLLDILAVVGARCEWQGDKGQRCSTRPPPPPPPCGPKPVDGMRLTVG